MREPSSEPDDDEKRDAGGDGGKRDAGRGNKNDSDDDAKSDDDDAKDDGKSGDDKEQPRTLMTLDECGDGNSAGLGDADVQRIKEGGSAGDMRWLYPYDKTVFPRGLKAPLLMWNGSSTTAVYLRIRSKYFEYDGCLKPTAAGQLQLPQELWEQAGAQTLGDTTPYEIELTELSGQTVKGPIKESIIIAQATLKGSIYYNSYNASQSGLPGLGGIPGLGGGGGGGGGGGLGGGGFGGAGGGIGGSGAVMRIRPGQDAELFARAGACTGCHAVSANGQRLVAKEVNLQGDGQVYAIGPDTAANPQPTRAAANTAFVGLSPDGSVYISTATDILLGPNTVGAGIPLPVAATFYETDTGTVIPDTGLPGTAMMPTFSARGDRIVFNDAARANGAGLSVMEYDPETRKATNQTDIWSGQGGYAGWPFLLPDDGAVIFTWGEASNFTGMGIGISPLLQRGPRSDLMMADLATGEATLLAQAMGFATPEDAAQDKTYLPFGAADLHQSYYPTVSPVAAGGYFWVFFDSVRNYGNLGVHRQLWATAIDIQPKGGEFARRDFYSTDRSHPAFYVTGQELPTANHRAFTALDPCRENGASCESGIDCCSGFCTDGVCGPPDSCADTDERCETEDDCCNKADACIAGFCGFVVF